MVVLLDISLMIFISHPAHETLPPATIEDMTSGRIVPFLIVNLDASFNQIHPVDGVVIKKPGNQIVVDTVDPFGFVSCPSFTKVYSISYLLLILPFPQVIGRRSCSIMKYQYAL